MRCYMRFTDTAPAVTTLDVACELLRYHDYDVDCPRTAQYDEMFQTWSTGVEVSYLDFGMSEFEQSVITAAPSIFVIPNTHGVRTFAHV